MAAWLRSPRVCPSRALAAWRALGARCGAHATAPVSPWFADNRLPTGTPLPDLGRRTRLPARIANLATAFTTLRLRAHASAPLALLAWTACAAPQPAWYTALAPDGPCYRVELADGLDETSTAEVQDLFACVNKQGHIQGLASTAAGLEGTSSSGVPAGVELARTWNALGRTEVQPLDLVDATIGFSQMDPSASRHAEDVVLELLYGQQAGFVRRDSFDVADPSGLEAGALAPLGPVVPALSRAVLDDDLAAPIFLAEVLGDPETKQWIWTMEGWVRSTDPRLAPALDAALPDLARALRNTRRADNDRWTRATGDSLRDLVDAATASTPDVVDRIAPELLSILADGEVRVRLPDLLVDLQRDGHLQVALAQATWLALVDVQGGPLGPGEDSALTALLRLLRATNRPMACEVDIGFTTLSVDLGNLAVTLLTVLADQDPDDVQGYASIIGSAFGYGLGEGLIVTIAETGVCPVFTPQVARDLQSLDRLSEPQARGLTHTLIGLVRVLRDGDRDHVGDLVQVVDDVGAAGLVPPLEEVLRDAGESDVMADVVALVPAMDQPARYGISARGAQPATLTDLLAVATWIVEPGEDGRTGWVRLRPVLLPALRHDGTWSALHAAAGVMEDPASGLARAHELIPPILDADPDLQLVTGLAPALADRAVTAPALRLTETRSVVDPLFATRPDGAGEEVPLAMTGRLIRSGAVADLLNLIRTLVRELEIKRDPN